MKCEAKQISDLVGEWGIWQRNLTIFVFILTALNAYNDLSYTFHTYEVDYWCKDVPNDYMYDLVCDRSNYASLSQSLYMFGFLITGLILSQFADKYGRKPLVWVSFIIEIIALTSSALSVNITQYSISRLFVGLSMYGCSGAMCTSLLESCGPKHRSDIYMLSGIGWVLGCVVIPGTAFWFRDFRYMNWIALLPIGFLMVWFYFIPESPRWLITNGRISEGKEVLRNIIKQNGLSDQDFDEKFAEFTKHLLRNEESEKSAKTYTVLDLLKTSNLRKYTLIFWFSWIVVGLVYYGFSLNMDEFGGNFYITFLLSGVVELPSAFISITALRYIGRRTALIIFLVIIAVSSLAIIPTTDSTLKVTFALIGKFAVGALWWIYEVYVPEVYPTVLRNTGAGTSSSFSRVGSMASPFMKNLAAITSLTFVMTFYAIISLFIAVLALFLPETKGIEIPDTLDEVETQKTQK
ncbi:unnamed protein product [Oppiella nova]|uniref:Major facilitator superfamily (MFS) profile domain-containing protein n=1 Tax=Oppiella nova TaxID=334625 RepID=A0A7R9LDT3_9ACAR|nr:unnamed protein product [Oppiella nova]CAG2162653.1 unnamed protein product [Oppiella nova]